MAYFYARAAGSYFKFLNAIRRQEQASLTKEDKERFFPHVIQCALENGYQITQQNEHIENKDWACDDYKLPPPAAKNPRYEARDTRVKVVRTCTKSDLNVNEPFTFIFTDGEPELSPGCKLLCEIWKPSSVRL